MMHGETVSKGGARMSESGFLSSEQVAQIWTAFAASTIHELAQQGKLPVAVWLGAEPVFARDAQLIRALRRLSDGIDR